MNFHVSRNFSLRSIPVIARRPVASAQASDTRASLAAQFIPAGSRVLDLSAAAGLQDLLPDGCTYQAYETSSFVTGGFPGEAAAHADIIVMAGTLERIADIEGFFGHLNSAGRDVVVSYRAADPGDADGERLTYVELAALFDRHGFRIECTAPADAGEMLMRLTPAERLKSVTPCRVAIITGSHLSDFGDRIGHAMIQAILPGEAEVDLLTPGRLGKARAQYDLAVLGIGNGLLQPLMDDAVIDILGRAKAAIGIFGTQHRALIPRAAIDRLIGRLDMWYARYQDDVLMYGRGRSNVVHLGDWTIDRFPMSAGSMDEPLRIAAQAPLDGALDHRIADIQRHRRVFSEQPHPLLCALTAAEMAAYAERPLGAAAGQFRSMLIDIFGRSYPEKEYFVVDRDAVARYKARVHGNVARVRERIEMLLRSVTVAA